MSDLDCYFGGALLAACVNFPIWRVGTIHQFLDSFTPEELSKAPKLPFRGAFPTITIMTWSRAAIFSFSELGTDYLKKVDGVNEIVAATLPPLILSTIVHIINTPFMNACIDLQNPYVPVHTVMDYFQEVHAQLGFKPLFQNLIPGIFRTTPKYTIILGVADYLRSHNTIASFANILKEDDYGIEELKSPSPISTTLNSIGIAVTSSFAGALLTNPLDVILLERTSSNSYPHAISLALQKYKMGVLWRGLSGNLVSVMVPVTITIVIADIFKSWKYSDNEVEGRE